MRCGPDGVAVDNIGFDELRNTVGACQWNILMDCHPARLSESQGLTQRHTVEPRMSIGEFLINIESKAGGGSTLGVRTRNTL